jgi:hypothetical protein
MCDSTFYNLFNIDFHLFNKNIKYVKFYFYINI